MLYRVRTTSAAFFTFIHGTAIACVTCDSATACQVRHGIFHSGFGHTLLLTAAPFPILLLATAAVYFAFPAPQEEAL